MKLKIPKQEYTAEFKGLAVKRVKAGQGIGAVARELGLVEPTLRYWVKAVAAGKLNGAGSNAAHRCADAGADSSHRPAMEERLRVAPDGA